MIKTRFDQFFNKVITRPPPPIQRQPQPPSNVTQLGKNKITHVKSNISDLFTAEFEINDVRIAARNILTKGQTHDEIAQHSGASISTRGRYISVAEKVKGVINGRPLYLFIQSDSQKSLDLAIDKIKEIIANTHQPPSNTNQMSKFNVRPPMAMPMVPQQNAGHATPTFIEKLMIGLEHAPPTFNVREQVIGVGGANLQYIRNETGAIATLRGRGSLFIDPVLGTESQEPLHLYIEHKRFDGLQAAKQLAKNLIETLQQEVVHLQQQSNSNSQNVALANNTIMHQGQHLPHLNVPPPMLVPPPVIQQSSMDSQTSQPAVIQQNFIHQNPPPNMTGPPQTVQSQQQTIIHQQIIPQTVPIQLQQSNVVIQQPIQQQAAAIGNVNIPPPGIQFPIKAGQIVQFQTPPPTAPTAAHLTQPPPNMQLQQPPNIQLQQPPPTAQIVLNHPQSYQYQYIQQPMQTTETQMQPNQVTIQHIYQPQQPVPSIMQQTQATAQTQQMQAAPQQQYITVQGNTAYMVPPPTLIQQQPAAQHNPHHQLQAQMTTSNPNIIFQPPPQIQQVQMHMTHSVPLHTMPPAPTSASSAAVNQENLSQVANSEETNTNGKDEPKSDGDQTESPQKSPKIKTEGDSQSNDSDSENANQTQATAPMTNVTMTIPPPQAQTISIKQPPPPVATSITLPVTQMAPSIMAVPPPMSCVQHLVGNTFITTHPTTQTHTQQIYGQVPVSIQHITPSGQQIHVSTPNGQHFLVNATPQWQTTAPAATITQQPSFQQVSTGSTIQNVQIATSQQIAHNGTDFRAMPPPTLANQTNQTQVTQQPPLAVAFNPQVQVQFQPQLVHHFPPAQTLDSNQIVSGQMTATHPQQQFSFVQQQQPQLTYHPTVMASFHPQQQLQQIKQITEQNIKHGQKRKHEADDPGMLNHPPRMGMGQRDQTQSMLANQQQQQHLHAAAMSIANVGNTQIPQPINGSANSATNTGQDENAEQKLQSELQQQLAQPPPPPPPTSSAFADNRPYYPREPASESFNDGTARQSFDGPPMNNGGFVLRGPRFHHNNNMMAPNLGYPMRPPFHMPPDGNGGNFPMHRMNFGPPPPPPSSYRGDCPPNINGGYGPPHRFRGQWL